MEDQNHKFQQDLIGQLQELKMKFQEDWILKVKKEQEEKKRIKLEQERLRIQKEQERLRLQKQE